MPNSIDITQRPGDNGSYQCDERPSAKSDYCTCVSAGVREFGIESLGATKMPSQRIDHERGLGRPIKCLCIEH